MLYEIEREHLLACLDELLGTIAPHGRFHAEGRDPCWRRRSGCKTFCADDARTFLQELLPDTDCTFTIAREAETLHIVHYHHDALAGEFYTVTPADEEEEA